MPVHRTGDWRGRLASRGLVGLVRGMEGGAMSLKATSWAWEIPTKDIGMTNKFVLLALADYADKDGACFPSQATLGDKVDLSERSIRTALEALEGMGLILREARSSTFGRRSDVIRLTFSSPCNRQNLPVAQPEKSGKKEAPATGSGLPVASSILNQSDIYPLQEISCETIYSAYPKKTAKGAALKAIEKALRKVKSKALLEAVQAYANATRGSDLSLLPNPATWFNAQQWEDDRSTWKPRLPWGAQAQRQESKPLNFNPGDLDGIDMEDVAKL